MSIQRWARGLSEGMQRIPGFGGFVGRAQQAADQGRWVDMLGASLGAGATAGAGFLGGLGAARAAPMAGRAMMGMMRAPAPAPVSFLGQQVTDPRIQSFLGRHMLKRTAQATGAGGLGLLGYGMHQGLQRSRQQQQQVPPPRARDPLYDVLPYFRHQPWVPPGWADENFLPGLRPDR